MLDLILWKTLWLMKDSSFHIALPEFSRRCLRDTQGMLCLSFWNDPPTHPFSFDDRSTPIYSETFFWEFSVWTEISFNQVDNGSFFFLEHTSLNDVQKPVIVFASNSWPDPFWLWFFWKKPTAVNSGMDSATKGAFTLNMANSVADDKTSENVCKYSPASIDVLQASILCANIMVEEDKKQ